MTSVPKPMKFLQPHYSTLKERHTQLEGENKANLADLISWLSITNSDPEAKECLKYRLLGNLDTVTDMGHEYIRHISREIGEEYENRLDVGETVEDLIELVFQIVQFLVTHNAEPAACDLLMEVEKLDNIVGFVDDNNFQRIALYLQNSSLYLAEPEDTDTLKISREIYEKMGKIPNALRLALKLSEHEKIQDMYQNCEDYKMKCQLAFMLGEHGYFELLEEEDDDTLAELMGNTRRHEYFKSLAKDLDVVEPVSPEDVFKDSADNKGKADSARKNLAATFANAFANAGFGDDKLIIGGEGEWLFKNKDHGKISATASAGLIMLWDSEVGPNKVDKYGHIDDPYVKAGMVLSIGVLSANVRTIFDIAFGYIADQLEENQSALTKKTASLALGIGYAGSGHEDAKEILQTIIEEGNPSIEVLSQAVLGLGLLYVGSCDPDISDLLINVVMDKGFDDSLENTHCRYMCLGLGLVYLGQQEKCEVAAAALSAIPGPMGKYALLTVETCAYAGTGNVLQIQKLLSECSEHIEDDKENQYQEVAVLGIALIAMAEDIGTEMVIRSFNHLLQYGEVNIKRAVPLALALLSASNPDITVLDMLSKLSHDHDSEVAMGAIMGLGIVGAGTNNSRIGQLLRNLVTYYKKDASQLFVIRLAQGLLHLGKGTLTLDPYHSHRFLLRPSALAGLLVTVHTCLDFKNLLLGEMHYMLFSLSLAMRPRMLMTFDEDINPITTSARVGKAVDVVGKAGNPKTITGFRTQETAVLMGYGDRAELASDDYIPYSSILEGCVVLKENPDSQSNKRKQRRLRRSRRKLARSKQ
eukprot:TRINITY_DN12264_c0_g1_i1.p1 TRINITY_DN12264_c0_g1~~TRINITY_DN12264_c0_g1_i1.p1  ORF type:complete len:888 (-),score=227.22 TRINITY_DN12264_c0_g1_i1:22-2463(-)